MNEYLIPCIKLLQSLISTPSYSGSEEGTAGILIDFLQSKKIPVQWVANNVWCSNLFFDDNRPTLLLNSHHDTVKPNSGYIRDPFSPDIIDDKLYGLGANDAGGSLVSLIAAFMYFYSEKKLKYNLILVLSAEEEITGSNGLQLALQHLPVIDCAIVGEPTQMKMAVAERGLCVVDATIKGVAGHVAHTNTVNPISMAAQDIMTLNTYQFEKRDRYLGSVSLQVTQIEAGTQHNVVPGTCKFVIDIRSNGLYTNEELVNMLQSLTHATLQPRSFRLQASSIAAGHPLIAAAEYTGIQTFGSATLSDQCVIAAPSVKIGPGDTLRSHSADEFILISEIAGGITGYIEYLKILLQ